MKTVTYSEKFEQFIVKQNIEEDREQTVYEFPNGYGASMIQLPYYTQPEMAVLSFPEGEEGYFITYSTLITGDVVQGIEDIDVELQKVFDLD